MKKRYVVAGILAAAGLICGGIAYYQYYQDAHAGQEYEKIKEKESLFFDILLKKEPFVKMYFLLQLHNHFYHCFLII